MLLFIEELILQLFKLIINSDIVDMIFEKIINFINSRALFQSIKKM